MKQLISALLCVLIISCSASKSATGSSKPNKRDLKGTWEVTNIRFVGEEGLYKANIFDTADSTCFKNSTWVFIPNNGTGKFTLNQTNNCDTMSQRILWSFFESGENSTYFQFKFVDEKNKPLGEKKSGYRMQINNLSSSVMEAKVETTDQGKDFDVVLSFQKVSNEINL